ncbi:MAG TPA: HDOD domain-containing protein [bacterium]|nr:HDOD domain-containing protein [bacterium]
MLAEKVESHEDVQEGMNVGYSLFQGYFFCKPEVVKGKTVPEYKINYLRFLQELSRPDLDFDELEGIIKQEVSLSMKLLRLLNSAAMGLRREVNSIKHALVLLGERPLKKWASLIAFTNLGDDKPSELLITCLVRARFCEFLARSARMADRELDLFLTGMFSAIDAVLDRPLEGLIEEMSLSDEVAKTLFGEDTTLSPVFNLALAFERADWDSISHLVAQLKVSENTVSEAYKEAVVWSREVFSI